MRRATVTLPDDLHAELERFLGDRDPPVPLSSAVQAAVREYLARRGYGPPEGVRPFRISPAPVGSGTPDGSVDHDRVLNQATRHG